MTTSKPTALSRSEEAEGVAALGVGGGLRAAEVTAVVLLGLLARRLRGVGRALRDLAPHRIVADAGKADHRR